MPRRSRNLRREHALWIRSTRRARVAERAFVATIRSLQLGIAAVYHDRLASLIEATAKQDAKGAATQIRSLEKYVHKQIAPKVKIAYAKMAKAVDDSSAQYMQAIGISSVDFSKRVKKEIQDGRDAAIAYVEDANRVYAAQVREIFGDPKSAGLRVEQLQARLQERAEVSASRAELIARDQTTKLLGSLNQARQKEAGITSYIWSTSMDERVREDHALREGQTFRWDDPPDDGHPGEPIQCRCSAIPVLEDDK